jgi:hypothetical protein
MWCTLPAYGAVAYVPSIVLGGPVGGNVMVVPYTQSCQFSYS